MIYEAAIRKSLRKGKYMFFLSRDGHTIRVSDARYQSESSAVSAAHNAAFDAHSKIGQMHRDGVVFRAKYAGRRP